jgi:signal transduction histidine kinase
MGYRRIRSCYRSHGRSGGLFSSSTVDAVNLEKLQDRLRWDRESIDAVEKCVAHQKVITDDVLNLSELETGNVALKNVDFNPKDWITTVLKMFEAEAQYKCVTLRANLPISDSLSNSPNKGPSR